MAVRIAVYPKSIPSKKKNFLPASSRKTPSEGMTCLRHKAVNIQDLEIPFNHHREVNQTLILVVLGSCRAGHRLLAQ